MRKYLLIAAALLFPAFAHAQGSRLDGVVQGLNGPIPNQFVAVCLQPANITTTPCSTLATLYTDITLSTPCAGVMVNGCANPIISDSYGNFHFYAAPSKYTIQTYGPQVQTPYVQKDIILPCDPDNCVFTNLTVTGNLFFGTLISNSFNPANSGTIRLEHPDTICWRNTANSGDLCLSVNNSDAIQFPGGFGGGGGGGTTVTINGGSVTSTLNINNTTPSAGANFLNAQWQYAGGNASVEIPISGNGSKVCSFTGSFTSGDIVTFDSNGNCIDGGVPPPTIVQHVTVTGCTNAGTTYVSCSVTGTWPHAFASNAYALACTANGPALNGGQQESYIVYWSAKTTTTFTIMIQNNRSITTSAVPVDCIGAL